MLRYCDRNVLHQCVAANSLNGRNILDLIFCGVPLNLICRDVLLLKIFCGVPLNLICRDVLLLKIFCGVPLNLNGRDVLLLTWIHLSSSLSLSHVFRHDDGQQLGFLLFLRLSIR